MSDSSKRSDDTKQSSGRTIADEFDSIKSQIEDLDDLTREHASSVDDLHALTVKVMRGQTSTAVSWIMFLVGGVIGFVLREIVS